MTEKDYGYIDGVGLRDWSLALPVFVAVILLLSFLGPVSAASLAVRDFPGIDPANPNSLLPCTTQREPMTLAACEAARAAMQASGIALAMRA